MLELRGNVAICFVINLKRGSRYTCHNKQLNIEHLSWPNIHGDSERDPVWKELITSLYSQWRTWQHICKWYTYVLPSRSKFFVCLPSSQGSNAAATPTALLNSLPKSWADSYLFSPQSVQSMNLIPLQKLTLIQV